VTLICQSCAEFCCECPSGYSVLRLRCDVCGQRVITAVAACRWQQLDPCGACGGSYSEEATDGN
jgi:hypothetical protein